MNTTFDSQFNSIDGLTWRPWVGDEYLNVPEEYRLLVVGESHYYGSADSFDRMMNFPEQTREIMKRFVLNPEIPSKLFDNFSAAINIDKGEAFNEFWQKVSFYNFIQRAMEQATRERPNPQDFRAGWPVFLQVIEVLQPKQVIFLGNTSADQLPKGIKDTDADMFGFNWIDKVGNSWAKTASFRLKSGKEVQVDFIKHSSSYFPTDKWRGYLEWRLGEYLAWYRE